MNKNRFIKCMLSLLLGLVCNVAWAETYTPVRQTTVPTDGCFLIYSESSSGSGWVHYDATQGRKYRVATDVDLSSGVTEEQAKFIWKLINDESTGTFALINLADGVYMPADPSRNANMSATTTANLALDEVVQGEGKWYLYQTNFTNSGNLLYIHTNAPGGYPNLSYWDSKSVDGTSIRAQFYKVGLPETSYTVNYMQDGEQIGTATLTYPTGFDVPEALLFKEVPVGYIVQGSSTLSGNTYTINVVPDILPDAGKYYRIGYDFGGNDGVKYMQSTASGVSGKANALLMTDEKGEGSIFLVEEVSGNLRLKSISTGKYLNEDGGSRGLYDTGGNVTFTVGTDGKIKIQAPSYLHANVSGSNYFVDHCGGDGCAQHNLIVEEVKVHSLKVNGPAFVGASASWNNDTKALPATWAIFDGITITNSTLTVNCPASYTLTSLTEGESSLGTSVEISSLAADRTITANFTKAFFSASTDKKDLVPVRIRSARNTNYTMRLNASDSYSGKAVNSGVTAYGENEIWYLVGTETSFKIYNRVAGTDLHIILAGTGEGSAASMNSTTDNSEFCLVTKDNGYAICPKSNTGQSFNMHGGAGNDIKLYGSSDGGSVWLIEKMDAENLLTMSVSVDKVWESSPRVAELTFAIDGVTSQSRITGNVDEATYYLPAGVTLSLSSMTYRGYTFNGIDGVDNLESFGIPQGGLELNVSYTANDERTLFYSPRDGHPYRIPAIATAPNGDIFAICDYRPCGNDIGYGEVDLVCRVSSDNGVTWTEERTIADGKGDSYAEGDASKIWQVGFGDPAIVADRERNEVLVMSVCGNQTCWDGTYGEDNENPNRVARIRITHDGEKWVYGDPEEVTYSVYPKFKDEEGNVHAASLFIGAGKICQSRVVKKGDYYRLYCAVWTVTMTQRQHHNYVIYSDDFGDTWNVLGELGYENSASKWGNEPKVEELPDGTVVLSSRKYNGRYFNLFTFADDTYTTGSWMGEVGSNEVQGGLSFGGNSTNGEIYKVKAIHKESGRICDLMFQSIPTGGGRDNVAIYYKEMEYNEDGTNKYTSTTFAQGWTKGIHVSTKGSCYSTMISQADGRIAFFFEEEPSGYCMVYIPYTIEELTGGAYSLYTVNSTISEHGIGTFYASEAVVIPEDVKAYVATEKPSMNGTDAEGNATGVITMTELKGIIPANTGAVLRGAAAEYKFIPSISYGTAVKDNMLIGYEANNKDADLYREEQLAEGYTTYVLAVENEVVGFYRKKDVFNVYNNKAYLNVPASDATARAIYFDFGGETGVDEVKTENGNVKTDMYDLAGRRVKKAQKGVYIVNGKVQVVK